MIFKRLKVDWFDVLVIAFLLIAFSISIANLCAASDKENELTNTWPQSAEFYQLPSGQDRFSEHKTNIDSTIVIVDHSTGIEYIKTDNGITVLLEEDGTPKRVEEAG